MPNWVQVARESGTFVIWYIDTERIDHRQPEMSVFWAKEEFEHPTDYGKLKNVKYVIHHSSIIYELETFNFHESFYYDSQGELLHQEQKRNPIHFIVPGTIFHNFFNVVSRYKKGASGCLVWIIPGFSVGLVLTFGIILLA